jgi:GNAT superfamily N-acetyltransferase
MNAEQLSHTASNMPPAPVTTAVASAEAQLHAPRWVLRPLGSGDGAAFVDLYVKAPAQDQLTRFCGAVSEEFVRGHAKRALLSATELLGLFVDGLLCAAAEVYVAKREAELAFLVAPEAQRKGMGSMLMAAALSVAHERGATSALVLSSPTNYAMHRVALVNGLTRKSSDMEWCAAVEIDQECDTHFPSVYQLRHLD